MSYPINYPTPQGANIQIFKQGGSTSDWIKPQGASFVWFTLIGAGGGPNSTTLNPGASAAVTNCMVPAFLIPDELIITVGAGGGTDTAGGATSVIYQQKANTGYTLLAANGGNIDVAAAASTSNYFSAMGFFQSVAGTIFGSTAAPATFLQAGVSAGGGPTNANYGYSLPNTATSGSIAAMTANGVFQTQPIIVGVGGAGYGNGGIGCGGGIRIAVASGGNGGDGLVVIITW